MKRVLKLLLSLPFLLALSALGVYALGGFVVAPWWLKRELQHYLKTQLDATGSVGEIAINPFKLTLDVRDFAVTESGGELRLTGMAHAYGLPVGRANLFSEPHP